VLFGDGDRAQVVLAAALADGAMTADDQHVRAAPHAAEALGATVELAFPRAHDRPSRK
jgi:hypothetical protein